MSRGPGRVERAIVEQFTLGADRALTVEDLAVAAYPGLERPAKRHRVAVLRAAASVAMRMGWATYRVPAPGVLVYADPCNVRGHALARLRTAPDTQHLPEVAFIQLLDDPEVPGSCWQSVQPDGEWWTQATTTRLYREGRNNDAFALLVRFRQVHPA